MILSALAIILAVFIGLPLLVIAFGVAVGIVFAPFAMAFELVRGIYVWFSQPEKRPIPSSGVPFGPGCRGYQRRVERVRRDAEDHKGYVEAVCTRRNDRGQEWRENL